MPRDLAAADSAGGFPDGSQAQAQAQTTVWEGKLYVWDAVAQEWAAAAQPEEA